MLYSFALKLLSSGLQVITNMIDYGMEPQAALDAPRWRVLGVDSAYGPESVNPSRSAPPFNMFSGAWYQKTLITLSICLG